MNCFLVKAKIHFVVQVDGNEDEAIQKADLLVRQKVIDGLPAPLIKKLKLRAKPIK
jgi:hypothetical protein